MSPTYVLAFRNDESGQLARFPLVRGGVTLFYGESPGAPALHQRIYEGLQALHFVPNPEETLVQDVAAGKCAPTFSITQNGIVEMSAAFNRDDDGVASVSRTVRVREDVLLRERNKCVSGWGNHERTVDLVDRESEWSNIKALVKRSMFVRASSSHQIQGDYWATDTETWCDATIEKCYPGVKPQILWGEKEHADMAEVSYTVSWASRTPSDGLLVIDDFGATLSEEVAGTLLQAIRERCYRTGVHALILTTSKAVLYAAGRRRIPYLSWELK